MADRINVRLAEDVIDMLTQVASRADASISEVVRRLIPSPMWMNTLQTLRPADADGDWTPVEALYQLAAEGLIHVMTTGSRPIDRGELVERSPDEIAEYYLTYQLAQSIEAGKPVSGAIRYRFAVVPDAERMPDERVPGPTYRVTRYWAAPPGSGQPV